MLKNKLPAVTIFLGSFLIFGVQPMLGRTLLPAFGGTAAVWIVCLASFQMLLLAGYFYAHVVSREKCANAGEQTRAEDEHLGAKSERSFEASGAGARSGSPRWSGNARMRE